MTAEPSSWIMWAQRQPAPIQGRELFHFGDRSWIQGCFGGDVVQVRLDEHPEGEYWGWLRTDRTEPTMVQPHRGMYTMQFPYGPKAEEDAGKGRTVRVNVTMLPEETPE